MLTISIPTYNRVEKLKKNIFLLDRELKFCKDTNIQVKIFDNNSFNFNFKEESVLLNQEYPYLQFYRNISNVGLSGNILKCLEHVNTEWVWILGDDDFILPNALNKVLAAIKSDPNLVYINFNSDLVKRKNDFSTVGCEEFVRDIDSFYNLLFISSGIYRVNRYMPFLKFGYLYNYTLAPHLSVLISSLNNKSVCLFSSTEILNRNDVSDNPSERWSDIPLQLSLMCLLELPLNLSNIGFNSFAKNIETHIKNPSYNFKVLLWYKEFDNHNLQLLYIYKQLFLRSFLHKKKFTNWITFFVFSIFIRMRLLKVIRYLYKILKKSTPDFQRFNRL